MENHFIKIADLYAKNAHKPFITKVEVAKSLGYEKLSQCISIINTAIRNQEIIAKQVIIFAELEGVKQEIGRKQMIINPEYTEKKAA